MHTRSWLRIAVMLIAMLLQPMLASAAPQVGWWWNASQSGRGFFIESQNGIMYLAGYLYESDGRATWVVSGGANADPYSYGGRLLAYRGGQTLFGDYQPPAAPTDAGPVSLSFSDDTHGTLTWPGGAIAIERQPFGGPTDDPYPPDPGWWWNDQESGRGYSVEVQGDRIFIVSFMYDDAGNPVWYYSAGQMDAPDSYAGPWLQFANGQTMTGPYHPPTTPVPVGQLSVKFTGIDEATFEFDDLAAATAGVHPQAGKSKLFDVKREFKAKATYEPADRYAGEYHYKAVLKTATGTKGAKVTTTITSDVKGNLTWDNGGLPDLPSPFDKFRGPSSSYLLVESADSPVKFTFTETQEGAGSHCSGTFDAVLVNDGSKLRVNAYAQYIGIIKFAELGAKTFELTCTDDDGIVLPIHATVPVPSPPPLDIKGKAVKGGIDGKPAPIHPIPDITVSGGWTFAAVATDGP